MQWTEKEVVDVDGPRAMLRAYLEQRDVREFCASVFMTTRIPAACDVGCGFGRLTPVLTEFAERVVGFEREAALLRTAQSLQPSTEFRRVETLAHLPAEDSSFVFGLVFTVLQHIPEPEVRTVIDELRRTARDVLGNKAGQVLTLITNAGSDPGALHAACARAKQVTRVFIGPEKHAELSRRLDRLLAHLQ